MFLDPTPPPPQTVRISHPRQDCCFSQPYVHLGFLSQLMSVEWEDSRYKLGNDVTNDDNMTPPTGDDSYERLYPDWESRN